MRPPCVPSRALRGVRPPLAFARIGQRHSLHTKTYDAAVVGGGITGLTAAYRLSQDPNCSKITLYEKSSRVGGWLLSETIPVEGGNVVFEYGPRTLRTAVPGCLPLLDLLIELGLHDDVLLTSKSSPAARNRFIYYPDHLVRMPAPDPEAGWIENITNPLFAILREPVFEGFLAAALLEPTRAPPEHKSFNSDESIADFVSRRLSSDVANNLVSALYHGIYAGDISRLSAQTIMGTFRDLENDDRRVIGGYVNSLMSDVKHMFMDDLLALESVAHEKSGSYWQSLRTLVNKTSVLTLKQGLGQLSDALIAALRKSGKVDVLANTEVNSISQNPDTDDLVIGSGQNRTRIHNRVIATIPAPTLAKQLSKTTQKNQKLPQSTIRNLQEHNYAVTVKVVNLYYPDPNLLPVSGFGYLIPRSIPYEQNPERALGVIFGSDSSVGQDTAPGTKLTVMMGGHWWDGWKESDYPDDETAVKMARTLLHRHLGITEVPTVTRSRLQRNAIPQYTVGHLSRMKELSRSARHELNNRLTLAGSWYNGVGVTDCIRQAYLSASYGVGARKLGPGDGDRPWRRFDYEKWDLEGGIVTSPVRWAEVYRSERKHF
ncbi:oxygen-dependent protoporphyrinogen oxidase [Aspergillus hancockii]|nr:oxygen-dependent protoporphyrinogen oxidase [Aspergillus hancockii]